MSVNAIPCQGMKIYIQSSTSGAKNITGVALGNPTIITSAAHGLSNGDVVTLASIGGTTALNGLTCVVKNKTTNTFAIDVDTTGGTSYTSGGTATPATFTQITQVKSIKSGDGSATKIDVTDLDSTAKEFLTGLLDNGTVSLELFYKKSDPGQAAVLAAFTGALSKTYKITDALANNFTFTASVIKFGAIPDGTVDGVQTSSAELQISGAVTLS